MSLDYHGSIVYEKLFVTPVAGVFYGEVRSNEEKDQIRPEGASL